MPRAARYHLPGHIWHLTHRCHRREFLLKFARDRRTWMKWLYEARKRYGLRVLDYTVTANHLLCAAAHNTCYVQPSVMWSESRKGLKSLG